MNTADIFLLVIIVASLLVGFFWGAARSLMLLAAWLVAFIIGAYLQLQVGAWLTRQWTNFDPAFNQAAAFGIIFLGFLLLAPIVIIVGTERRPAAVALAGPRRRGRGGVRGVRGRARRSRPS